MRSDIAKDFIAQSRGELVSRLRQTLTEADGVFARLDVDVLLERRQARGEEVTVFLAVYHAVEHFSMHTGQIIMLTKLRSGDLRLPD